MDWNKLQKTLYDIEPSNISEDYSKLKSIATGSTHIPDNSNVDYINESIEVPEGSLNLDNDYSINDFAKLAGIKPKENSVMTEGILDNKFTKSFVQGFKKGYSGGSAEPIDDNKIPKKEKSLKRNPVRLARLINGDDDPLLMRAINKLQTGGTLGRNEMSRLAEAFKQILEMDKSQVRMLAAVLSQNAPQQSSANESKKPKEPVQRNPVVSNMQKSGAGVHQDQNKKNMSIRKQKHKGNKPENYENISLETLRDDLRKLLDSKGK